MIPIECMCSAAFSQCFRVSFRAQVDAHAFLLILKHVIKRESFENCSASWQVFIGNIWNDTVVFFQYYIIDCAFWPVLRLFFWRQIGLQLQTCESPRISSFARVKEGHAAQGQVGNGHRWHWLLNDWKVDVLIPALCAWISLWKTTEVLIATPYVWHRPVNGCCH